MVDYWIQAQHYGHLTFDRAFGMYISTLFYLIFVMTCFQKRCCHFFVSIRADGPGPWPGLCSFISELLLI